MPSFSNFAFSGIGRVTIWIRTQFHPGKRETIAAGRR
jgi:hypothetical protein